MCKWWGKLSPEVLVGIVVHVLGDIGQKVALFLPYTGTGWLKDGCGSMLLKVPTLKSGCCISWGGPIMNLCIKATNISSHLSSSRIWEFN